MPLISIVRFLTMLISLSILAVASYLLWGWWRGDYARVDDVSGVLVRDSWPLWTGLFLAAMSLFGRVVFVPLLARGGKPQRFSRQHGQNVKGARSPALFIESSEPTGGQTIVLTHGQGMDTTFWTPIRAHLLERFRVIAWDLPGMGRSKRTPKNTLTLNDAAADLEVVVKSCGGPVLLVGHSLGGMTVQHLARTYPETFARCVSGVVLLNTTYTNPLNTMILSKLARALQKPVLEPVAHLTKLTEPLAWLAGWQSYLSGWAHVANRIQFDGEVTRAQLEHITLVGVRNPPGVIQAGNLGMFHWEGLAPGSMKVPVLVIAGGKDIVTKREASDTIVADLPNARLLVIDQANHMGPVEQSSLYAEAISAFATEVALTDVELTDWREQPMRIATHAAM